MIGIQEALNPLSEHIQAVSKGKVPGQRYS